jgi:hypothetical protein
MRTDRKAPAPAPRDSGEPRIISLVRVGPHTYRVTTESERYGLVTQDVLLFPESVWGTERPPEVQEDSLCPRA